MNEETRLRRLTTAMRVIAIVFFLGFSVFLILVVFGSAIIAQGTFLAVLLRWKPYNVAYEGMIAAIYVVWGIFLWRASENPQKNGLFIDFTIWANLAHALEMLVAATLMKGELMHVVGDVLFLAIIAAVLLWLRPRPQSTTN
jgi:hypothetical protein